LAGLHAGELGAENQPRRYVFSLVTKAFKVCNFEADFSESENCEFHPIQDGELKVSAYPKPVLSHEMKDSKRTDTLFSVQVPPIHA